jgi:hypothetical protein
MRAAPAKANEAMARPVLAARVEREQRKSAPVQRSQGPEVSLCKGQRPRPARAPWWQA